MFCANNEEFLVLLDLDIVNIWICRRTNMILFVLTQCRFQISSVRGSNVAFCWPSELFKWPWGLVLHVPTGQDILRSCRGENKCFGLSSLSHAWVADCESKTPGAFHICYLLTTVWHDTIDSFSDCTKSLFWSWRPRKMEWSIFDSEQMTEIRLECE